MGFFRDSEGNLVCCASDTPQPASAPLRGLVPLPGALGPGRPLRPAGPAAGRPPAAGGGPGRQRGQRLGQHLDPTAPAAVHQLVPGRGRHHPDGPAVAGRLPLGQPGVTSRRRSGHRRAGHFLAPASAPSVAVRRRPARTAESWSAAAGLRSTRRTARTGGRRRSSARSAVSSIVATLPTRPDPDPYPPDLEDGFGDTRGDRSFPQDRRR